MRRKEYASKRLYDKRQTLLNRVPDFWPSVFANGPEEVQQFFAPTDLAILASLKSFFVDRYQIESETKGDPRSLRFTFEFADNEYFEDSKLVKEFEYKPRHSGPGSLISQPVPIKWKSKKKDVTDGLLAAAVELHAAEDALKLKKGDKEVEIVDRESLWQYEKLREKLVKLDDESPEEEASFFNWFGFRGAVDLADGRSKPAANGNNAEGDGSDDEESEQAITLEVEIFPAGEEVANALAEELWTDAMDYFSKQRNLTRVTLDTNR